MRPTGHPAHAECVGQLLQALDNTTVRTWFDIGLLLDQLRDDRIDDGRGGDFAGTASDFSAACVAHLGSIGQAVDGAVALDADLDDWPDTPALLARRMERGSGDYNALIASLWTHTASLVRKLADAVVTHELEALIVHDVWATPRNVPLALALAILTEHLRLPIIATRTQPWWREADAVGANRHMGEVFAAIATAVPWDAPWVVHVPADAEDRDWLVGQAGINPARLIPAPASGPIDPAAALQPVGAWAAGLDTRDLIIAGLDAHAAVTRDDTNFHAVARATTRHYLPGLTELEYMIKLDSLIDPSAFRAEENELRGRVYGFAEARAAEGGLDTTARRRLLAATEALFSYHVGEDDMVVDHSLSYRHRHRRHYPWRKLTECEVTGVVGAMARAIQPAAPATPVQPLSDPADITSAVTAITGAPLAIDQTDRLRAALTGGRPLVWLPNSDDASSFAAEAALFRKYSEGLITVLVSPHWGRGGLHAAAVVEALQADPVMAGWLRDGRLRLIPADLVATGTHLMQLGPQAAPAVSAAMADGATVISIGHANLLTLDLLAAPSIRIGRADGPLAAAYMDIPAGQGYCLWVPAGLRPSLAYPTPIQTPRQFAEALSGASFAAACEQLGEARVLDRLTADAEQAGTPVAEVLAGLVADGDRRGASGVTSSLLTGVHANGAPWSGAYAQLAASEGWDFHTVFARGRTDTVLDLIDAFVADGQPAPALAWNGGYILNPELVGKLGLPEDYIGSPLGLLIENGRVRSLPLFNKPALAFNNDGSIAIREANIADGLTIAVDGGDSLTLPRGVRNLVDADGPAYFDLMADMDSVPMNRRVAYRFAGGRIISVHEDIAALDLLPVGLTVVVPADQQPAGWVPEADVRYTLPGWEDVANAIEAGPMLVRDHRESIEMDAGGWTRQASIRTQAARLDYTHMRGPKIGVGVTADDQLIVVAINGRIRESVGATHGELAAILLERGAETAMGFDPGGSVTLVVDGRQLNISPYNRGYIDNPWSLPPQPRFVGNAILAVPQEA